MNHAKKISITIGVILVTILITFVFAGQALRQEVAGQESPANSQLFEDMQKITQDDKTALNTLPNQIEGISIADMFQMQLQMNKLSQISELSVSVVTASNQATQSIARDVKG